MMLTDDKIFEQLLPLVREITGARAEEVTMQSNLMRDLGAESIDLLDLSFLIEETFGITLEIDEFESRAKESLGEAAYEKDGYLTPAGIEELRLAFPEVQSELLTEGLRKIEVPSILNVAVFVHLIHRKLAEQAKEV
jgi:acyl carrier protein